MGGRDGHRQRGRRGDEGHMGPALAVAEAVQGLGVVAAALAAGGALLLPGARHRAVAALVALTLTPILLLGELWDSPQLVTLRSHGALALVAVLLGGARVAGLPVGLRRPPWLLPPPRILALPFPVPPQSGRQAPHPLGAPFPVVPP